MEILRLTLGCQGDLFMEIYCSLFYRRLIISVLSLSGIVLTALIVGVLSEALQIPTEEKRVLVSMEHQRTYINIACIR